MQVSQALALLAGLILLVQDVSGHGMMLEPPNRSSLWRFYSDAPKNYEDNQNFCGGFQVQYEENGGKCGVCGDNYKDPQPRGNENTGKYGQGRIVRVYEEGSVVNVSILVTANHLGAFYYSICDLKDPSRPEPEDCFVHVKFANGKDSYKVDSKDYQVYNAIRLPKGLKCEHCVLRWHYQCGNNWGLCADGTGALGCGIQESFRSCSDIRIV